MYWVYFSVVLATCNLFATCDCLHRRSASTMSEDVSADLLPIKTTESLPSAHFLRAEKKISPLDSSINSSPRVAETIFKQCKEKLLWVHVPKTGSTLCMLFQHLCCPYEFLNVTHGVTMDMLEENALLKQNHPFEYSSARACISFTKKETKESTTVCNLHGVHDHIPLFAPHSLPYHLSSIKVSILERGEEGDKAASKSLKAKKPLNQQHVEQPAGTPEQLLKRQENQLQIQYRDQAKRSLLVTMIRHPLTRLLSSYLDSKHHEGLERSVLRELEYNYTIISTGNFTFDPSILVSGQDDTQKPISVRHQHQPTKTATSMMLNDIDKEKLRLYLYQKLPQAHGCQVKMLNGWDCFANTLSIEPGQFNQSALQYAKDTLRRRFVAVGIFEEFTLSMKLMMKRLYPLLSPSFPSTTSTIQPSSELNMHTVTEYPPSLATLTPVEIFPQRTTNNKAVSKILERFLREHYRDPYDEALYEEAKKIFWQHLKEENMISLANL